MGEADPKNETTLHEFGAMSFLRSLAWLNVFAEKLDNVFGGSAGKEDFSDALVFEFWQVLLRHNAADEHEAVGHPFLAQQLNNPRAQRVVRAAQYRNAYSVDVLLKRGSGNHLWRLPQTGVDDFHSRVTKRAGDDLRPTIVTVKPGLCYEYADFSM